MIILALLIIKMNETTKELIRETFQFMIPVAKEITNDFYEYLFTNNPELKKLFHGNMDEQKEKFIHMISISVEGLEAQDELITNLRFLGKKHLTYGVKDNHYDLVKVALIWSIEKNCIRNIKGKHLDAWKEFYDYMASYMKEGEKNE